MKKVFLDDLPRKEGVGVNKGKQVIDWINSIDKVVYFTYFDISGEFKIVNYDGKYLYIKYLDKEIYKIITSSLVKCQLGGILELITKNYKIDIETIFKDDNRDITIIDRKIEQYKDNINLKFYKYKCNICNCALWIEESNLLKGVGCGCCNSKQIILGINTIFDKAKWMIPYIGEENAKIYAPNSNKNITMICPDCGFIKNTSPNHLFTYGFSCKICSDKISYPERFMISLLKELKIDFIPQLNKTTFKWCNNYKYDFYVDNIDNKGNSAIIECHGMQHYEETTRKGARTLKEEQENDKNKEKLAKENGIKYYFVIDCRYSNIEFIKKSILDNKIMYFLENKMNNIDWNIIEGFARKSIVKLICELKRDNPNFTTTDIAKIIGLERHTVREYLKQGTKIWDWINYNPKEERRKIASKIGKITGQNLGKTYGKLASKKVEIFKNDISLGIFDSCTELSRQSENLFGIKLTSSKISEVCRNVLPHHKGYVFKYINENNVKSVNKKDNHSKQVICIETKVIYNSIAEAQKITKINNISACCRNNYSHAGGFKWMYKEDYNGYIKQQNIIV